MNTMTTTTVNLRVEAEAEARRLAVARSLGRPEDERGGERACASGPLIARARGGRRRQPAKTGPDEGRHRRSSPSSRSSTAGLQRVRRDRICEMS
jgi:hypothetical protein